MGKLRPFSAKRAVLLDFWPIFECLETSNREKIAAKSRNYQLVKSNSTSDRAPHTATCHRFTARRHSKREKSVQWDVSTGGEVGRHHTRFELSHLTVGGESTAKFQWKIGFFSVFRSKIGKIVEKSLKNQIFTWKMAFFQSENLIFAIFKPKIGFLYKKFIFNRKFHFLLNFSSTKWFFRCEKDWKSVFWDEKLKSWVQNPFFLRKLTKKWFFRVFWLLFGLFHWIYAQKYAKMCEIM